MKNIHVLPTKLASRLVKQKYDVIDRLCLADIATKRTEYKRFSMYITSDEEIKDCWVLNTHTNEVYFLEGYYGIQPITKKIILTTDQDLVKNGVQAIDDEFLGWFVNNSSCEEIKTIKVPYFDYSGYSHLLIIPKEEPKQVELLGGMEKGKQYVVVGKPKEEPNYKYQSNCICDTECQGFINVKCKKDTIGAPKLHSF